MNEENTEGAYKVKAVCNNCEWEGEVEIQKGTRVEEQPCPQCGCAALMLNSICC